MNLSNLGGRKVKRTIRCGLNMNTFKHSVNVFPLFCVFTDPQIDVHEPCSINQKVFLVVGFQNLSSKRKAVGSKAFYSENPACLPLTVSICTTQTVRPQCFWLPCNQ